MIGVPKYLMTSFISNSLESGKKIFSDSVIENLIKLYSSQMVDPLTAPVSYKIHAISSRPYDYHIDSKRGSRFLFGIQGSIQLTEALFNFTSQVFMLSRVLDHITTPDLASVSDDSEELLYDGKSDPKGRGHRGAVRELLMSLPPVTEIDKLSGKTSANFLESLVLVCSLYSYGLRGLEKMGLQAVDTAIVAFAKRCSDIQNRTEKKNDGTTLADIKYKDADLGSFISGTLVTFVATYYSVVFTTGDQNMAYEYVSRKDVSLADTIFSDNKLKAAFIDWYQDRLIRENLFNDKGLFGQGPKMIENDGLSPDFFRNMIMFAVQENTLTRESGILKIELMEKFLTELTTVMRPLYLVHSAIPKTGAFAGCSWDGKVTIDNRSYDLHPALGMRFWTDKGLRVLDSVTVDPMSTPTLIDSFASRYSKVIPLYAEFLSTYFDFSDIKAYEPRIQIRTRDDGDGRKSIYWFGFSTAVKYISAVYPYDVIGTSKEKGYRLNGVHKPIVIQQHRGLPSIDISPDIKVAVDSPSSTKQRSLTVDDCHLNNKLLEKVDKDTNPYYGFDSLTKFDNDMWRYSFIFMRFLKSITGDDKKMTIKPVLRDDCYVAYAPSWKPVDFGSTPVIVKADGSERCANGSEYILSYVKSFSELTNSVDKYFAYRVYEVPSDALMLGKNFYERKLASLGSSTSGKGITGEGIFARQVCFNPVYRYNSFSFRSIRSLGERALRTALIHVTRRQALPSGFENESAILKDPIKFTRSMSRFINLRVPIDRDEIDPAYLLHPMDEKKGIIFQTPSVSMGDSVHRPVILYDKPFFGEKGDDKIVYADIWVDLGEHLDWLHPSFVTVREKTARALVVSVRCPVSSILEPKPDSLAHVKYISYDGYEYGGQKISHSRQIMDLCSPIPLESFDGSFTDAIRAVTEDLITIAILLRCDPDSKAEKTISALVSMTTALSKAITDHLNVNAPLAEFITGARITVKEFVAILDDFKTDSDVEKLIQSVATKVYEYKDADSMVRELTLIYPIINIYADFAKFFEDLWLGYDLYSNSYSFIRDDVAVIPELTGEKGPVTLTKCRLQNDANKILNSYLVRHHVLRGW